MKINEEILNRFIQDQDNKYNLIALAEEYMSVDQLSMAFTYYMKCAEACSEEDYELKYHSLMCLSYIFWKLGNRDRGALQYLRFAKAECPDRPEAYYFESMILAEQLYNNNNYEQGDWSKVYETAKIGCLFSKLTKNKQLPTSIYYPGQSELISYYLISLLRINKLIELNDAMNSIDLDTNSETLIECINYICNQLGWKNPLNQSLRLRSEYTSLNGSLPSSSSECGEDIIASIISTEGSYLDITTNSIDKSNTIELERIGWKGIVVSPDITITNHHTQLRTSKSYCFDSDLNYGDLLINNGLTNHINYLSLDCIPEDNLRYLESIIKTTTIDLITIIHNNDDNVISSANKLLTGEYTLLSCNVKTLTSKIQSDWYIRVDFVKQLDQTRFDLLSKLPLDGGIGLYFMKN